MNDIIDNDYKSQEQLTNSSTNTPILDNFSVNLNTAAKSGEIDPLIGREDEVTRISDILLRRKKNNPILIGPPGVGKTQIIEGLALRIVNGNCPKNLIDKKILSLNLSSVVAGTKYRGQFEERLKAILEELKSDKDVIIFIDEIHTLIGSGNSSGSMDGANILKPALARGDIQVIGATTYDEYRKLIEKDGALDRRFQKILVDPLTVNETISVLNSSKLKYENHHKVEFSDKIIELIVNLSEKYIRDREFPDKAFDVLDEVGARLQNNHKYPEDIDNLKREIDEVRSNKFRMVKDQNFEAAADLRDLEKRLINSLHDMKSAFEVNLLQNKLKVTEEDVYGVISKMSNIPLDVISKDGFKGLKDLSINLKSAVIGQDDAIDLVVDAIKRNSVGIRSNDGPIGSFLLIGSSGVGKTYLAKMLAKYHFGSDKNVVRLDMSEFQEKSSLSKLIGTSAGYVGYDEGNHFTEKVRMRPYSIVLVDEIEKAHPDNVTLFLQILDDGYVTDGQNKKISFKNTIIIFTSNIGVRKSIDFGTSIGYTAHKNDESEVKQNIIQKEVDKYFPIEFINRLDSIVYFNQLTKENALVISKILIDKSINQINSLGYSISYDDEIIDFICENGFNHKFGARDISRSVKSLIENHISDQIINDKLNKELKYKIYLEMGSIQIKKDEC